VSENTLNYYLVYFHSPGVTVWCLQV